MMLGKFMEKNKKVTRIWMKSGVAMDPIILKNKIYGGEVEKDVE